MRRILFAFLMILLTIPVFCIELSEPDPEDTRRITAIIQYTSEFRFGDNLKKGDEVVYEVNEEENEEYAEHVLKVIDKNDTKTTVLELFEGNELYVEFLNTSKKVTRIWGKDIAGGDHNLTLLSQNEIDEVVGKAKLNEDLMKNINKWKVSNLRDNYEVANQQVQCREIELDIDKLDLPESAKDKLREKKTESSILVSNDIPKMLPLVPVAVPNIGKKEFLTDNAGFVRNNNLRLKSFKRGE
jgi:hypothetical protein